jgi:hypothetical protein
MPNRAAARKDDAHLETSEDAGHLELPELLVSASIRHLVEKA